MRYFKEIDSFVAFERDQARFKLLDGNLQDIKTVRGHTAGPLFAAEYLADYHLLCTTGGDKMIRFWGCEPVKSTREFCSPVTAWRVPALQTALKWNEHTLYSADVDGRVLAWSVGIGETKQVINAHRGRVTCLEFMSDCGMLASASVDGLVKCWDSHSGKNRVALAGHNNEVQALSYSEKNGLLFSGGKDDYVLIWSPKSRRQIARLNIANSLASDHGNRRGHVVGIECLEHEFVIADDLGRMRAYDYRNFQLLQTFHVTHPTTNSANHIGRPMEAQVECMISRDNSVVCASGRYLFEFRKETNTNPDGAHDGPILFASFNPETMRILTGGRHYIKVWDAVTGCLVQLIHGCLERGVPISAICESDNGRRLFVADEDGNLRVYSTVGTLLKVMSKHQQETTRMIHTVHPVGGERMLFASFGSTVGCHDASKGGRFSATLLQTKVGHNLRARKPALTQCKFGQTDAHSNSDKQTDGQTEAGRRAGAQAGRRAARQAGR